LKCAITKYLVGEFANITVPWCIGKIIVLTKCIILLTVKFSKSLQKCT